MTWEALADLNCGSLTSLLVRSIKVPTALHCQHPGQSLFPCPLGTGGPQSPGPHIDAEYVWNLATAIFRLELAV